MSFKKEFLPDQYLYGDEYVYRIIDIDEDVILMEYYSFDENDCWIPLLKTRGCIENYSLISMPFAENFINKKRQFYDRYNNNKNTNFHYHRLLFIIIF